MYESDKKIYAVFQIGKNQALCYNLNTTRNSVDFKQSFTIFRLVNLHEKEREDAEMSNEVWAGIPLAILIIGALITRRIIEPAVISSVVSVLMEYRTGFVAGYVEKMYQVLSDPSFQLLVIVAAGFAGLSALLEKSGAMLGFRGILEKLCTTKKKTVFFTWLLGGIIFIDDYLNALAVSAAMKGISDEKRIPREHLAYTVNCMGACVCVMLPFSSWAAFAMGCASEQGLAAADYIHAIPFMFYPICAIGICLLLAFEKFPLLGELKKAYGRVRGGGPLLEKAASDIMKPEDEIHESSPLFFLVPMAALIAGMLLGGQDIVVGLLAALLCLLILLSARSKMGLHQFFDVFLQGASVMMPMLITIFVTFIMEAAIDEMGFIGFLTGLISRTIPAWLIPVTAFVIVGTITFFAASFWALIVIAFPIFLPMALAVGVNPSLVIGAVMSGAALGSQACLYSDAIFMVAAGTEVPNDTQFRTVLPYVLTGAAVAAALFVLAGIFL